MASGAQETTAIAGVRIDARDHGIAIFNTGTDGVHVTNTTQAPQPVYEEPKSDEMKAALLRELVDRGATRLADDTVAVELAGAGFTVQFSSLEKIGCQPAQSVPGYRCDFNYALRPHVYTRESGSDPQVNPGGTLLFQLFLSSNGLGGGIAQIPVAKNALPD